MKKINVFIFLINSTVLMAHTVLVEFKSAYFKPSDSVVRSIYGNGAALYGPEITFQVQRNSPWYGFVSADFLSKNGNSIGLCNSTTMYLVPLAFGVKYFEPFCYGNYYGGLGFQPLHLKTVNCSTHVDPITTKWGFGFIAKLGAYFDLSNNFFLDLFIDYSFARVGCDSCATAGTVTHEKVNLDGVIFGAGLAYRF